MATESIVLTPRLDRKFTDGQGNLTQNAYALLSGLIRRTGGVVSSAIDMPGMEESISALEQQPEPFIPEHDSPELAHIELPPEPAEDYGAQIATLRAELDELRGLISGLLQVPQW
jgi:hypothetical protein